MARTKLLTLEKKIEVIKPYSGKSKFPFWNDMLTGDIIHIKTSLAKIGDYKPIITCNNERTGLWFDIPINAMCNYLSAIEFKELTIIN